MSNTTPKAIVLSGYGINCERETANVLEQVGFSASIVHINDLIEGTASLTDASFLVFPGGFSYGDDIGSGKAFAAMIKNHLWDDLVAFKKHGGIALGICNGFQIMTHLGLFSETLGEKTVALIHNDSARYLCTWVPTKVEESACIFTRGMDALDLPIAHGEGKFFANDVQLKSLEDNKQIALTYTNNPNGSIQDIAGICDSTGRFFGLMPHPERAVAFHHHPAYHKRKELLLREGKDIPAEGDGLQIFVNAYEYCVKNTK